MTDLEFIAPVKTTTVTFSINPVQNLIGDLVMLTTTDFTGFADWVKETAESIPDDLMQTTRQVMKFVGYFVDKKDYPTFPDWLDYIASRDPYEVRDEAMSELIKHAQNALGDENGDIPDPAQIMDDEKVYNRLMERIYAAKGKPFEDGCCDHEYDFFQDPVTNQKLVVDHLTVMWEKYLQSEWERNIPMLEESVAAFEMLDLSGKSLEEILPLVADRDFPEKWQGLHEKIEKIVFVPSPHIGPYLIAAFLDESMAITFGARIPKGAGVSSPALDRSELVTRLNALADDTRLRILDLVSNQREIGAQEIINELSLSQSAASRHLRQLVATGFLVEQRREGAKFYQLNQKRVEDAFDALKDFLG